MDITVTDDNTIWISSLVWKNTGPVGSGVGIYKQTLYYNRNYDANPNDWQFIEVNDRNGLLANTPFSNNLVYLFYAYSGVGDSIGDTYSVMRGRVEGDVIRYPAESPTSKDVYLYPTLRNFAADSIPSSQEVGISWSSIKFTNDGNNPRCWGEINYTERNANGWGDIININKYDYFRPPSTASTWWRSYKDCYPTFVDSVPNTGNGDVYDFWFEYNLKENKERIFQIKKDGQTGVFGNIDEAFQGVSFTRPNPKTLRAFDEVMHNKIGMTWCEVIQPDKNSFREPNLKAELKFSVKDVGARITTVEKFEYEKPAYKSVFKPYTQKSSILDVIKIIINLFSRIF